MSDEKEQEEKTEEASTRKLDKMREEGQVAKSADVASAATLGVGLLVMSLSAARGADDLARFSARIFSLRAAHDISGAIGAVPGLFAKLALPVAIGAAIASIALGFVQTRGLFQIALAFPKADRFSMSGLSRLLSPKQAFTETGKMLIKVGVVALVVWHVIEKALPLLSALSRTTTQLAASAAADVVRSLFVEGAVALAIVAAADYALERHKHAKEARMTKQETRDEHKEQEGNPQIKGARRRRARQLAQQRAISGVKQATVIVTNPTHIAVALRYVPGEDAAPVVLAKGIDEIALQMRAEARELRIPVIENRPLARAMHKTAKVGDTVPVDLYEPVAKIIAHVLALKAGGRT